jgi:hypothetical protein
MEAVVPSGGRGRTLAQGQPLVINVDNNLAATELQFPLSTFCTVNLFMGMGLH